MKRSRKISTEELEQIFEYFKTHTLRNTSSRFGRDVRTLKKLFAEHGIALRTHEEELELSKAAAKQTCLLKYGVDNPQKNKEVKAKTAATCLERYGVTSYLATPECQQLCAEAVFEKYGVYNFLTLPESHELAREAMLERYGVEYAMQDPELKAKKYETQRENGHMNTSEAEETFYSILLQVFPEDDIIRQYKEERYPYFCDFYIKSLDLFIEINHFYTHHTRPFNKDRKEDLDYIAFLQTKGWLEVVKIWAGADVEKRKTAELNNLNYLMYYPKDELSLDRVLAYK